MLKKTLIILGCLGTLGFYHTFAKKPNIQVENIAIAVLKEETGIDLSHDHPEMDNVAQKK